MNSARYLTSAYVFALSLVACSSICAYFIMTTLIKTQDANATLINIAGRQHRLSQQIALNCLRLTESRGAAESQSYKNHLARAIDLMAASHSALSTGSHDQGLPGKVSAAIKSIYFEAPTKLDWQVANYLNHARRILKNDRLSRDDADLEYILITGPTTLVDSLDALVKQYEIDSNAEIKDIQRMELYTLIFTLTLLTAEAFLIFRPMSAKINKQMQELIDSQKELKAVFNTVGEALLTMDGQSSIVTANDQVQILWGHGKSDLIGKSLTDLFCKSDGPIAVHDAEMYGKRMEMNCVAKDGREFPVELVITKTALSDRELFTLSARDISALKRAEKQVSEFYSVVSHELRTPLTAIRGALGLMEGGMVGELPEETKEFVSIARVEADRMTRLVNDILDLRKIAAGRLDLKLTQCDLAELAKESINAVQSLLSEAQVKVETNLQADCVTYCDRDRIIQIIENLLSNAIKFSPHESTIRVTIRATEPNYYRIAVQDQGPGIAEDKQEKLFQMFLQLDSSDVRKKGGSGLGLAISKALVEQHGGQIGVISAEGAGAKFWFDLPIKSAPPVQNESVPSSSQNKK